MCDENTHQMPFSRQWLSLLAGTSSFSLSPQLLKHLTHLFWTCGDLPILSFILVAAEINMVKAMKSLLSFFEDLKEIGQHSQTLGESEPGDWESASRWSHLHLGTDFKKREQGLTLEELQPPFSKPLCPPCHAPPLHFSLLWKSFFRTQLGDRKDGFKSSSATW